MKWAVRVLEGVGWADCWEEEHPEKQQIKRQRVATTAAMREICFIESLWLVLVIGCSKANYALCIPNDNNV